MYIIGLTGGIATGKSTVGSYLKQKNIPIIDCDILAHQAVEVGKTAYHEVIELFGDKILNNDSTINRQALGLIIFTNTEKRLNLERIVHKQVLADVNKQLESYRSNDIDIVVIDIPLLFEVEWGYLADEIWVVICKEDQQIARLIDRNNLSFEDATDRIAAQMPLKDKIVLADTVLDNSNVRGELYHQIEHRLKELKHQKR